MSIPPPILKHSVLERYGIIEPLRIEPFGGGLINHTWKVTTTGDQFILQRINDFVFQRPQDIARNIALVSGYLKINCPDYFFVGPVLSIEGEEMIYMEQYGFFRLFPFVPHSHSKAIVNTPEQAYQAASQFGRFTSMLRGFDTNSLAPTIPQFHDLNLRYRQFRSALASGDDKRKEESKDVIRFLISCSDIVSDYKKITSSNEFKTRVTHHDTKISNVLFDAEDKGLCVIDLDTVMPGYFISDVGDMMRTYLSPAGEEEDDFSKILVRENFYQAIVEGYYSEMENELTAHEKNSFFYAGKFMIYMQALRFLTDYLNNDRYYGAKYPGHNLVRSKNQVMLLKRFMEMEKMHKPSIAFA